MQRIAKIFAMLLIIVLALSSGGCHDGKPHEEPKKAPEMGKDDKPLPQPNPDKKAGPPGKTPEIGPTPRGPIPTDPRPEDEHQWVWFVTWTPAALFVLIDGTGMYFKSEKTGGRHFESGKNFGRKEIKVDADWTDRSNKNTRTPPHRLHCSLTIDGLIVDEDEAFGPGEEITCQAWTE